MLVLRELLGRPLTAREADNNFEFLHITEWATTSYLTGEFVYNYDAPSQSTTLYVCLVDHDYTAYAGGFSVTGTVSSVVTTLWQPIAGGGGNNVRPPLTGTWEFVTGGTSGITTNPGKFSAEFFNIEINKFDNKNVDWSGGFNYLSNLNNLGGTFLFQLTDVHNPSNVLVFIVNGSNYSSVESVFNITGVTGVFLEHGAFSPTKDYNLSFIPFSTGGTSNIISSSSITGCTTGVTGTDLFYKIDNKIVFKQLVGVGALTITEDDCYIYLASSGTTVPVGSRVTFTNEPCHGDLNGTITLYVTGGTNERRFSIDGGVTWSTSGYTSDTTYIYTGLSAGLYSAILVDDQGLGHISLPSVTITEPPALGFTTSITNELVSGTTHDGIIVISAFGGTTGYTYSINNGGTWQSSPVFTGLTTGSYTTVVKDSNNCVTPGTFTIVGATNTRMRLSSISSTNPACSGGSGTITIVILNGSGSFKYRYNGGSWVPGSPTSARTFNWNTGILAGSYNVQAQDTITGAIVSGTTVVTNPPTTTVTFTGTSLDCGAAGNATLFIKALNSVGVPQIKFSLADTYVNMTHVTGNTYTYLKSYSSVGTYANTMYYNDGCSNIPMSYNIHKYSAVGATPTLYTQPVCPGEAWIYNTNFAGGSGVYDYKIGAGAWVTSGVTSQVTIAQSSSSSASSVVVSYRDRNNISCTGSFTVNNSKITAVTLSIPTITYPSCYGGTGSFTFTASGGRVDIANQYVYKLISPAPGGGMSFTVTSIGGGGSITGYSIYSNGGGYTVGQMLNASAGNAILQVLTINGTGGILTFSVISSSGYSVGPSLFGGNPLPIVGSTWSSPFSGSMTITGLAPNSGGSYSVEVVRYDTTPLTSCGFVTLPLGAFINQPPQVVISYNTSVNPTTCGGSNGSITLNVAGGTPNYRYSTNGGVTFSSLTALVSGHLTITGLSAGTITIYVKDANNCSATTTVTRSLAAPTSPVFSSTTNTPPTCYGGLGSVTLVAGSGTPPYTYSNDNITFVTGNIFSVASPYPATTYWVKDSLNCKNSVTITVIPPAPVTLTLSMTAETLIGANDGTVTVNVAGGTPPYTYVLTNVTGITSYSYSTSSTSHIFTGLEPVLWQAVVTDNNGCSSSASTIAVTPGTPVPDHIIFFRANLSGISPNIYKPITPITGFDYTLTGTTYYLNSSPFPSKTIYQILNNTYADPSVTTITFGGGHITGISTYPFVSPPLTLNFANESWQSGLFILVPDNGIFPDLTDTVTKHLMDGAGIPFAAAGKRSVSLAPGIYGSGAVDHPYILYNVYSISQPGGTGTQTIRIT